MHKHINKKTKKKYLALNLNPNTSLHNLIPRHTKMPTPTRHPTNLGAPNHTLTPRAIRSAPIDILTAAKLNPIQLLNKNRITIPRIIINPSLIIRINRKSILINTILTSKPPCSPTMFRMNKNIILPT